MENEREAFLILAIGTNNTGKSTLAKELVENAQKTGQPVLVIVKDSSEWPKADWVHPKFPHHIENYVGVRKIIYYDGLLDIIYNRFEDGLLVFDDCKSYLKTQKAFNELETFLQRRRQKSIDVIVVGHGFTQIPVNFFSYATHYALFRTRDNINRRSNSLPDFEVMREAQARINARALDPKPWFNEGKKTPSKHYYEILEV